MKTYKVTIFRDCHASNNIRFRNLAKLEADSVERLARKSGYNLIAVREEKISTIN